MSMQLTIFEHSITEKRCCRCKEVKPLDSFYKHKRDKLQSFCKQCEIYYYANNKQAILQHKKLYYLENKDRIKQYKLKNAEKIKEKQRNYYIENKEKLESYKRGYYKKRVTSEPIYRLISNLRARVSYFCKSVSMQKNWRTLDALGCNPEEFIAYFEPLFTEGMTWQNYGAWHVDHIKPISLAKTEHEAKELNHYTNLQPLWAADNIRKSNKYDKTLRTCLS